MPAPQWPKQLCPDFLSLICKRRALWPWMWTNFVVMMCKPERWSSYGTRFAVHFFLEFSERNVQLLGVSWPLLELPNSGCLYCKHYYYYYYSSYYYYYYYYSPRWSPEFLWTVPSRPAIRREIFRSSVKWNWRIPFWNHWKVFLKPWTLMVVVLSTWRRSRSCSRTISFDINWKYRWLDTKLQAVQFFDVSCCAGSDFGGLFCCNPGGILMTFLGGTFGFKNGGSTALNHQTV